MKILITCNRNQLYYMLIKFFSLGAQDLLNVELGSGFGEVPAI